MRLVDFTKLPSSIQIQIPLSIRTSSKDGFINIDSLPLYLSSLLNEFYSDDPVEDDFIDNTVYDVIPKLSKYNNLETIENVKDTILHYIQNFFHTGRGSYPFIPEHGTIIKQQLMRKDSEVAKMLIQEEMDSIAEIVGASFEMPIKILSKSIEKYYSNEDRLKIDYMLSITIQIKNQSFDAIINPSST